MQIRKSNRPRPGNELTALVGEVCRRRWVCGLSQSRRQHRCCDLRPPTGWVGGRLLHVEVGGNCRGGRGAAKAKAKGKAKAKA